MSRPGDRLRLVAARCCRPETMERLIDPIVADLQAECAAAGASGWRRRRALWRGYLAFWKALALHGVVQTLRPGAASAARPRSVLACSAIAFALMTAAMVAPPMLEFVPAGSPLEKMWLMALLVPQSLPLSIPMGVCVGTVCAMRGRRATGRHLATVLIIAAVATFAVWTML